MKSKVFRSRHLSNGAPSSSQKTARSFLFAHSPLDAILVALSLGQLALMLASSYMFPDAGWLLLPLAALLIFIDNLNFQCVAHNFLHNPFFRFKALNYTFGIVNSLGLGVPQDLYKAHHLNHHKYGNDIGSTGGDKPKDRSSSYSYPKRNGEAENIITYALLGPFRGDLRLLYEDLRSLKLVGRVWTEAAALAAFHAALCFISWRFYISFFVPVWYAGMAAGLAQNYLEHNKARPGDRFTDSVSCYNKLYNLVMFNEGYHQEHHVKSSVHWSRVKELRGQMLPADQRRVVKGAIWFNV